MPSQVLEDKELIPISNEKGELEHYIDKVIRCITWQGEQQALVKWTGLNALDWTSLINIKVAIALDLLESKKGPKERNRKKILKRDKIKNLRCEGGCNVTS